jgi:triosephosphate isomerase
MSNPHARQPHVGGNWKMNLHHAEAQALAAALAERLAGTAGDAVEVSVFPAFPYLAAVSSALCDAGSAIKVGAQDAYTQANGAYTGEVSLSMLQDVGTKVVLIGHSERRHVIGETDALINEKVHAALNAGFEVILAIGEKLEQREAGQTDAINLGQTALGLAGVSAEQMSKVTLAYEPVWAIGTGKTATPQDAQAAHAAIRAGVKHLYGSDVADAVRIQYGGSMKPGNAADLLAQPDIDGGLIGGAALKPDDFTAIVEAAR